MAPKHEQQERSRHWVLLKKLKQQSKNHQQHTQSIISAYTYDNIDMKNPCSANGFTASLVALSILLHPVAAFSQVEVNVSAPADLNANFTIHRFAAIGDSYATGVGAGKRVQYKCSRYDHAYGYLVNNDIRDTLYNKKEDEKEKTFQFKACYGARTKEVIKKQLPKIDGPVDAMTLTIGGNDMGFVNILNDCVFGWKVKSIKDCQKTIKEAFKKIEMMGPSLDKTLKKAIEKLTPVTGRLYVTGYGKMFDDKTTQCNSADWSWWKSKKNRKPLIQERRKQFNDIADALNIALKEAVERAGEQAVFVDVDHYWELCKGRSCEADVNETRWDRPGLLFFGYKATDVNITQTTRINATSLHARCITNFLPDKLLKTCHPRSNAYRIVADLVLWHMEVERAKYLGLSMPPRPGVEVCIGSDRMTNDKYGEAPHGPWDLDTYEFSQMDSENGAPVMVDLYGSGRQDVDDEDDDEDEGTCFDDLD